MSHTADASPAIDPVEITRDNDLTFQLGPNGQKITGINPTTGVVGDYPSSTVTGWIAITEDSDTSLGGAAKTFTAVSTARFVPFFEASEVNAALTAAATLLGSGFRNGVGLWCVVKGANELRIAIPLVYRKARRA